MLTNNLMDSGISDFLYEKDIIIEVIKYLDYGEEIQQKYKDNKVLNTASKINIFNLKKYDKLVYIDADCDFIKNCDLISQLYDRCFVHKKGRTGTKDIKTRKITDNAEFRSYYELIQAFKTIYNFYHRWIINYEPYLGQLNTIEEDFINYLLDTFGVNEINTSEKPNFSSN